LYSSTSEDPFPNRLLSRLEEIVWRSQHYPDKYDLFIDQTLEKFFIRGKKVQLQTRDMKVLATMLYNSQQCTINHLFYARYNDAFNERDNRQRTKFSQYISRLRKELSMHGIKIPRYRYHFNADINYCLIYKASWELDPFHD
jgi:DNA-binding response OmpR family regulator